nr:elongation factor P-like protein YeiP [Oceanococcus sp. HetDA_MAG_MS8]
MAKASELKSGMVVEYKGAPYIVRQVQAHNPTARGAATLYKARLNHAVSGQKLDASFKGDDQLVDVDFQRRAVQFLYRDAEGCTFMDKEDYTQHVLSEEQLANVTPYLSEDLDGMYAVIIEEVCVAVSLPAAVELSITETAPAMKSASATSRTKPAKLSTGLEIQVPEYLGEGEVIRVSTEDGSFLGRA